MSNTATIAANEITVRHSVRPEINREFLTVSCPNGWEDVKKLTKKVLTYDGRKFAYTSWNSDTNECFFVAPYKGSSQVATIS